MKIWLTIGFVVYNIALIITTISICNYQDTFDMGFTLCITGGISLMGFILYTAISWLYGKEWDEQ